jgi:hypothetical protein
MADYFYAVDISRNEELARTPSYVDKFLVELVCEDHRNEDNYQSDREHSASEIALEATKQRYGLAGTENSYKRANEMAAGFQRISAKPDTRHRADAAFGTCDVFETHVSRRTSDAQNR